MSSEYDDYLYWHKAFVREAWIFMKQEIGLIKLSSIFPELDVETTALVDKSIDAHDLSKYKYQEYAPYDEHFYGNKKGSSSDPDYDRAWLHHIHNNKHHWQHWVLIRDEGELVPIDIPMCYVIEMVCDWWSFSFSEYLESRCEDIEDLYGIFGWYDDHKSKMIMTDKTRKEVEDLLSVIMSSLDEKRGDGNERG